MTPRRACAVFALVATALAAGPVVSYFARMREISTNPQLPTNYFVVDPEILQNARPDLGDLRILSDGTQVPYALAAQAASVQSAEREAKVLNLGAVGGSTEFDLDLIETVQYNHIRLDLDAKDYLITARIFGKDVLAGGKPVDLGVSTLYDFSRENLGANTTLRFGTSSFRYLHVVLTSGIRPSQVKRAWAYGLEEKRSYWTDVGSCQAPRQVEPQATAVRQSADAPDTKTTTVIDCEVPMSVAMDRVAFTVAGDRVNFRRPVVILRPAAGDLGSIRWAAGEISRVQMKRGGVVVNSEQLSVPLSRSYNGRFSITIANGDDPPLALIKAQPQAVERRVFFEPKGAAHLRLYYGDGNLEAPIYDYAKFFKDDEPAAQAALGPAEANAAFTGRPDDRPWSERHQAVLWAAMVAAVAGLGILALRGLKQG